MRMPNELSGYFVYFRIFICVQAFTPGTSNIVKIVDQLQTMQCSINPTDVSFYLFTRKYRIQAIKLVDQNLTQVPLENLAKLIVHGWGENAHKKWYSIMTREYLTKGNYSIIQVDWSTPAFSEYSIAACNTRLVGNKIARLIVKLFNRGIPLNRFHIIGHSLGSHVAGFAGKKVESLTGDKIERITGLDPAGPLFESGLISSSKRLGKNDAKTVDVIHTDGGVFGFQKSIGTVDFFPNGGSRPQPGCTPTSGRTYEMLTSVTQTIFCSHTRSYMYYIESINTNRFVGTKCESWYLYVTNRCNANEKLVFGDNLPSGHKGNYFLNIAYKIH